MLGVFEKKLEDKRKEQEARFNAQKKKLLDEQLEEQ